MLEFHDRIRVYAEAPNITDAFLLGPQVDPTFRSFLDAGVSDGATVHYVAFTSKFFECGEGIYSITTDGAFLSRDTIYASSAPYSGQVVPFGERVQLQLDYLAVDASSSLQFDPSRFTFSASDRLLGRDSPGAGPGEEISVTGGLEFNGSLAIQIAKSGVTYQKIQDVTATARVLGRKTAGAGVVEELDSTDMANVLGLVTADSTTTFTNKTIDTASNNLSISGADITSGVVALTRGGLGADISSVDGVLGVSGGVAIEIPFTGSMTTFLRDDGTYAVVPPPNFTAADKYWYGGVGGALTEGNITAAGRAILDDADAAAQRTTLGLGTGDSPTFAGLIADSINVDTINEKTANNGVNIDGALLKDGGATFAAAVDLNANSLILDADGDTSIGATADDMIDFKVGNVDVMTLVGNALGPVTNDLLALGSVTKGWADLFLASGGVVNFNNGNYTLTHSSGKLAASGPFAIVEAAAAGADVAGEGQFWVKDNAPNTPFFKTDAGTDLNLIAETIIIECSDETTDLTMGAAKVTWHMPFGMTLTGIIATVTEAPTGSVLIADVNSGGTSIMTTNKLSIDAGETSTETAATPPTLTTTELAKDAVMTADIDQVGSTTAGKGLKIYLVGYRSS